LIRAILKTKERRHKKSPARKIEGLGGMNELHPMPCQRQHIKQQIGVE